MGRSWAYGIRLVLRYATEYRVYEPEEVERSSSGGGGG